MVIGGGINGAAIAHLAARSGASVALVEKNDWASGTSSKSTKLLHGGIRYLENFEFDLVAESLKERFIQYKSVPHLVKPLQFIIPVYAHEGRPLWMMKLGVWLYDALSGCYSFGAHQALTKEEVIAQAPGIRTEGLRGGVSYFDAQMDDARIVLENVLMARASGAETANYVEVESFLKEGRRIVGARLRDGHSKEQFDVMADKIIVAAGPWTDQMKKLDNAKELRRLRPTKGVHIICRGSLRQAFLLQNKKDNRVFFAIPFKGNTLIGTTDTDFKEHADSLNVTDQEIDYLLNQAAEIFPEAHYDRESIIDVFAGIRPLAYELGSPSKVSRKHVIEKTASGRYYIYGGKYTTYRAMALECVHKVLGLRVKGLPKGDEYQLYGSGLKAVDIKNVSLQYGMEARAIDYLIDCYGSRFDDVLQLIKKDASLKGALCSCSLAIRAQVVYAKQVEMARTPEDIYERRLSLVYNDCPTKQCKKTIEDMFNQY